MSQTSQALVKQKLAEYLEKEGDKRVKSIVVVFELPFSVSEDEVNKVFSAKFGKIKKVDM